MYNHFLIQSDFSLILILLVNFQLIISMYWRKRESTLT